MRKKIGIIILSFLLLFLSIFPVILYGSKDGTLSYNNVSGTAFSNQKNLETSGLKGGEQNIPTSKLNTLSGTFVNPFEAISKTTGADVTADSFEVIGDNVIAHGNVKIRKGSILLYSDNGVINYKTKNVELAGNVRMYSLLRMRKVIEYWQLERLEKDPNIKMKIVGTLITPTGRQKIITDIIYQSMAWKGKRVIGNLQTNIWRFHNFAFLAAGFSGTAKSGIRYSDGKIMFKDAEVSSCPTLMEGHSVFSVKSNKIIAYPVNYLSTSSNYSQMASSHVGLDRGSGLDNSSYNKNRNDYSAWMFNNTFFIGNIPIFWLPILYKPTKKDIENWTIKGGYDSSWGGYVNITDHWDLYDTKDVSLSLTHMLDVYSRRGIGTGVQLMLNTLNSKSELFSYIIPDANPNINRPTYSRFGQMHRWGVRYDIDLRNYTRIYKDLEFRGRFVKLSDYYFLYNYFHNIAMVNPEPSSYADLLYEKERFALNFILKPKWNRFYSEVEKLPELTLSIPRQNIWRNLYYQSNTSLGFYKMSWRKFKYSRSNPPDSTIPLGNGVDPKKYYSGRFDTVHFVYYPFKIKWINLIPRAGFRFTTYTNSSKKGISTNDLNNMFIVQTPENTSDLNIINYDNRGHWRARLIGEFGISASTKFHRTWENVKSGFLELNGLRHVVEPYIDYTLIPKPTLSRSNIYYFDDIDRIDGQNFVRIGVKNRLQTRKGDWSGSKIYTWASSETYIDFLFSNLKNRNSYWDGQKQDDGDIRNIGDIGHRMSINPSENLSINAEILVDGSRLSGSNIKDAFKKATISTALKIAEGWELSGGWFLGRKGVMSGEYSMGSSYTRLQAGSVFFRRFTNTNGVFTSLKFKINDRTSGVLSTTYQFEDHLLPSATLSIARQLPCNLLLLLSASVRQGRNTNGSGRHMDTDFGVSLAFTASPNYIIKPRTTLLPGKLDRASN